MRTNIESDVPPILVLGIGNSLLADDGVGLALLELIRRDYEDDPRVQFVDGGTQGMLLVGLLEQRRSLLLLDAIRLGAAPGHVHLLRDAQRIVAPRGLGAHGGNASELLTSARLLDVLPERVLLVGVEPSEVRTRLDLSGVVRRALPAAAALAGRQLLELFAELHTKGSVECTS